MCFGIDTFWSSIKTTFRIITILCIVTGVVTVFVTANVYNSRRIRDTEKLTDMINKVDKSIDYMTSLKFTIISAYLIFIGWEALETRYVILMHVYSWGMLIISISLLIFVSARYSDEQSDIRDDLAEHLNEKLKKFYDIQHNYLYQKWPAGYYYGWIGNYFAVPHIRDIALLQKAFECCGRRIREHDFFFLYNKYHGKFHDLPYSCCRHGFYRRRCKWGEHYSKGCPERIRTIFREIISTARIALFCYFLTLFFCAIFGIACVIYLHTTGYKVNLRNINEQYSTRAQRKFGIREITSEDRQNENKMKDEKEEKESHVTIVKDTNKGPLKKKKDDTRPNIRLEYDKYEKKRNRKNQEEKKDDKRQQTQEEYDRYEEKRKRREKAEKDKEKKRERFRP